MVIPDRVTEVNNNKIIFNEILTSSTNFTTQMLNNNSRTIYFLRLIVHRTYCRCSWQKKKNTRRKIISVSGQDANDVEIGSKQMIHFGRVIYVFSFLIFGWDICMARDGRKSIDYYIFMNDCDFYDRHGDAWYSDFSIITVSDLPLSLTATRRFGLLFLSTYVWCSWGSMMMLLRLLPAISMQMKHEDRISISFPVFVCISVL